QPRAVRRDVVPVGELVEVADVVRLEDDDPRRLLRLEAAIDLDAGHRWWCERIDEDDLTRGFDDERGDLGFPVVALAPLPMGLTPEPQSGSDVPDLDRHRRASSGRPSSARPLPRTWA